jgi:hypothetical protein
MPVEERLVQQFAALQAEVDSVIMRCAKQRRDVPAQIQQGTESLLALERESFDKMLALLRPSEHRTFSSNEISHDSNSCR